MKKLILILVTGMFWISSANGQLKDGDALLGPSLGFWSGSDAVTLGLNYESQVTQMGDVASLGLGGVFRFSSFKSNNSGNDYYESNNVTLGFQSNMNFNRIADGKFVPMVGLVLGYNNVNTSRVRGNGTIDDKNYNSGIWLWGQLGARYFFSPKVAGVLRIGAGNYNFNTVELAVDFKL